MKCSALRNVMYRLKFRIYIWEVLDLNWTERWIILRIYAVFFSPHKRIPVQNLKVRYDRLGLHSSEISIRNEILG
jgi:hypothetical protein